MKLMTILISGFAYPFVEGSQIQAGEWMRILNREGYEINFCFLQAPRGIVDEARFRGEFPFVKEFVKLGEGQFYGWDIVRVMIGRRAYLRKIEALRRDSADGELAIMLIVGLPWAGLLWNLRGDSRITFSPIDSYAFRFSRQREAAQGVLAAVKATLSTWFAKVIEKNSYKYASRIFVVGKLDAVCLEGLLGREVNTVPLVKRKASIGTPITGERAIDILLLGNLAFEPLYHGTEEFLSCCADKMLKLREDTRIVVQSRADSYLEKLEGKFKGVEFVSYVDDFDQLLSNAKIVVLADLSGTGLKNRILDAFRNGCCVVSTKWGTEGMGLESGRDVIEVGRPSEMLYPLMDLLGNDLRRAELVENAGRTIDSAFSFESVSQKLLEAMNLPGNS